MLKVLNRLLLRFKPARSNVEDDAQVLQVYDIGSRHGAMRSIKLEDAQLYPDFVSFVLRPPLPMTIAAMAASYGA